jgi:carbonic anhydrase
MSRLFRAGATRLIEGVDRFQRTVFGKKEHLFRRLGEGQSPGVLFVTCSDSRINPNLLTQTEPGELFILRTAGNLVPPAGSPPNGEAATVEYAVAFLKVGDVIVCGHSKCGAVGGLLNPAGLAGLPEVQAWLRQAEGVREEVTRLGAGLPPEERLNLAVERNTLRQVENLRTHPAVRAALAEGRLRLHAWVYHFETGEVVTHDPTAGRFVPLAEAARPRREGPAGPAPTRPAETI